MLSRLIYNVHVMQVYKHVHVYYISVNTSNHLVLHYWTETILYMKFMEHYFVCTVHAAMHVHVHTHCNYMSMYIVIIVFSIL